jgi:hypothetical protein
MMRPTPPSASLAIVSVSRPVQVPSVAAIPSHVAERTNRFAKLMPLIMVGSKRIDIDISPELMGYLAL